MLCYAMLLDSQKFETFRIVVTERYSIFFLIYMGRLSLFLKINVNRKWSIFYFFIN